MSEPEQISREDINDLLQELEATDLAPVVDQIQKKAEIRILQNPTQQTLMVPVGDPVSNTDFYCGEVLTTSAVVQVEGHNGWAMVLDNKPDLTLAIAILDGAWAADLHKDSIRRLILAATVKRVRQQEQQAKAGQATTVHFDLM